MNKTTELTFYGTGMVRIMRNANFSLQNALLELIDNSLDAEATAVTVIESNEDLIIKDNGRGFDDIEMALCLGMSDKIEDNIGRYGIGLKQACAKFSRATEIISNGVMVYVPWDKIDLGINYCDAPDAIGSTIILRKFRDLYGAPIQTGEIRRVYKLAMERGISLSIKGEELTPIPEPVFIKTIEDTEVNFQGKKALLRGGIFKTDDPNRKHWAGYNGRC